MRRFFSILLMLLLPLQFSFAAAAAYCMDDKPEAVAHFGHHDHADDATDFAIDGDEEKPDCEICHLACAKAQAAASLPAVTPSPQVPVSFLHDSFPQYQPEPNDRPPIVSAA